MKHHILIAEDDEFLSETIAAALKDHEQATEIALDGEKAIVAMDKR